MAASAPRPADDIDTEALRDTLTREWLAVVARRQHLDVIGYDSHWWDGQTWAHCLVVTGGQGRQRIIETEGEAVVVPFSRRQAAKELADRRLAHRGEPVPEQRHGQHEQVHLDASDDVVRCGGASCGALVPLTAARCPLCGSPSTG